MFRILLTVIALVVATSLLYRFIVQKFAANRQKPFKEPSKMVGCAYCQLYVEQDEAIYSNGQYFCSSAHRKLKMK